MHTFQASIRLAALLVGLAAASASHATITAIASASAFVAGSQDTFNDLAINGTVGSPLTRSAGGVNYTVTGFSAGGSALTALYGAAQYVSPNVYNTAQGALSTDYFTDYLSIKATAGSELFALGFNLYGTQNDGSAMAGVFDVKVTNALSETFTGHFSTVGMTSFVGYASSAPITSVTITNATGATASYVTIDNLYLNSVAAVPEPSTYALLALGLLAVGYAARRRNG